MGSAPKRRRQYLTAARAGSSEGWAKPWRSAGVTCCRGQSRSGPGSACQGRGFRLGSGNISRSPYGDFGRFQGSSEQELLAWLRLLLLHNVANFTRRYRGTDKRRVDREVGLDGTESAAGRRARLATDTPSPSSEAIAHEQAEKIRQALGRLPEDYRRVILSSQSRSGDRLRK